MASTGCSIIARICEAVRWTERQSPASSASRDRVPGQCCKRLCSSRDRGRVQGTDPCREEIRRRRNGSPQILQCGDAWVSHGRAGKGGARRPRRNEFGAGDSASRRKQTCDRDQSDFICGAGATGRNRFPDRSVCVGDRLDSGETSRRGKSDYPHWDGRLTPMAMTPRTPGRGSRDSWLPLAG
jgi:hypothetical protein